MRFVYFVELMVCMLCSSCNCFIWTCLQHWWFVEFMSVMKLGELKFFWPDSFASVTWLGHVCRICWVCAHCIYLDSASFVQNSAQARFGEACEANCFYSLWQDLVGTCTQWAFKQWQALEDAFEGKGSCYRPKKSLLEDAMQLAGMQGVLGQICKSFSSYDCFLFHFAVVIMVWPADVLRFYCRRTDVCCEETQLGWHSCFSAWQVLQSSSKLVWTSWGAPKGRSTIKADLTQI